VNVFFKYKKSTIALIVLAASGGIWYWQRGAEPQPVYREAVARRDDIELAILATGIVQPRNRLEIKPPIAGRIEQVPVQEGQNVARGQLLAMMSSSERAALLDAARAKGAQELKQWQELYRATPIYAPMNGTVIARNVEPGQTVSATDAVLVMSDRLAIKAQVDETDIAKVRRGQYARVTLDAYPDQAFDGVVEQIAFDAKTVNNVTTYEVDVLPQKIPSFMRSGMTANVNFIVSTKKDVVVVPTQAIRFADGNSHVLVPAVAKKDPPLTKSVQTGLSDGRRTEVLAGVAAGDIVLVPQIANGRASSGANPFGPSNRTGGGRR
jgi:macrolide-specific efflux system membrane fusion protein